MGAAIAEVLPDAVAVALVNPIAVVAVILLLFSPRARSTAWAFVGGWVIGMSAVLALLVFVVPLESLAGDERQPSMLASIVSLLLGLALLYLALGKWRGRSEPAEDQSLPAWMARLEAATPLEALGFGALLSGPNPKNFVFTLAAAVAIAQAELPTRAQVIPFVVYVLLTAIGVAVPVIWHAVAHERATRTLAEARVWLIANYATIMAVVFLLFGVKLLGQGLGGLIG